MQRSNTKPYSRPWCEGNRSGYAGISWGRIVENSPSEQLLAWVRSTVECAGKRSGAESSLKGRKTFWRELIVTMALLAFWRAVVTGLPIPVVRWVVAKQFADQFGWFWGKLSIGALGLGPYLLAHSVMFWVVMVFSRLRRMEFRYLFSLNTHVLGLTFILAIAQAWYHLSWLTGICAPGTGQMGVSPYFWSHQIAYRLVGISALVAGLAFTLFILQLIQQFGIPCPLTCMLIWTEIINLDVLRMPWRVIKQISLNQGGNHPQMTAAVKVGTAVFLSVLVIALVTGIVTTRLGSSGWATRLAVRLSRFWPDEPRPYYLGTNISNVIYTGLVLLLQVVLFIVIIAGIGVRDALTKLLNWLDRPPHPYLMIACMAVLSLFLFYRLVYNPALRHQLGAKLGLTEELEPMRVEARRALVFWCVFILLMIGAGWLRSAMMRAPLTIETLGPFYVWDIVLLVFTICMLRGYYRLRREGLDSPVMTHGYYEPLLAARALLGRHNIRSQMWGEPTAFLTGLIVGPAAMKRLLVSVEDRDSAVDLLSAVLADAGRATLRLPGDEECQISEGCHP
jgi:hypothetical protein